MKLLVLTLALATATPAFAGGLFSIFPASIPTECVTVAQRERVPIVMKSKDEAIQAAMKLERLDARDPAVAQCRQTVSRLKAFL